MIFIKNNAKSIILFLFGFLVGFFVCHTFFIKTERPIVQEKVITGAATTETKTVIEYVPKTIYIDSTGKEEIEKTDLQIDTGKQELNIKINGQNSIVKKQDNELFVFDENKIQLTQSSKADINIKIPTIDKTNYWAIGAGYGNNGAGYILEFPVNKNMNIGGFLYADKSNKLIGATIKF